MIRVILFVICVAGMVINTSAQTSKGMFMIGGTGNMQRDVTTNLVNGAWVESTPKISIAVNPTFGYFLDRHVMVGIEGAYSHSWQDLWYESIRTNGYGAGPLLRYYAPLGKTGKVAIVPELAAVFTYSDVSYYAPIARRQGQVFVTEISRVKGHDSSSTYRAGLGAVWFAAPYVGIETFFGYKNSDFYKSNIKNRSDVYFNIGLQFYLARKS